MDDLALLNAERTRYVKIALLYVQNQAAAEDIFQDCILYLLSNREKVMVSNIRTYFHSMIRFSCYKHLRKDHQSKDMTNMETFIQDHLNRLPASEEDIEDDMMRMVDFQKLIRKCCGKMSDQTFEIFAAKVLENMSYREMSERFGVSERRARYEFTKAQKIFKEEFHESFPVPHMQKTAIHFQDDGRTLTYDYHQNSSTAATG